MKIYKFIIYRVLYILIYFKVCNTQHYNAQPTVNIAQGTIVGTKVYPDVSRIAINTYLGIPYAEPPIGRLRFAVPVRHRGWNGTFYAANYGPICPFRTTSASDNEKEDCLYLNIWTPENGYNYQLPVIIFMESEQTNSESIFMQVPGHDLAMDGAVVVSVSYRQNIFGFFCLGTSDTRGNLGLLDQYLALVWVKENISKFGGDPQLVTLMGHSSSAITILHQMVSPRTSGLFKRAILMSGPTIIPKYENNIINISNKLTNDLGCALSSVQMSLDCLRTKSVQEILRHFDRQTENIWYKSVIPVTDTFLSENERYLPIDLQTVLTTRNFTLVPLLLGITDFLANAEQWKWSDLNQDFSQLMQYTEESVIPAVIKLYDFTGLNKDIIKEIIRWKYLLQIEGNAGTLVERIHKLQWDAHVAAPYERQLNLLKNTATSVYAYCLHQFSTLANISTISALGGDLLLLFGPALLQQVARRRFTITEATLSKHIKQMWITFAKEGTPTPNGYRDTWHPYTNSNKYIQHFGDRQWDHEQYENIRLWNYLLPKLVKVTNTMNSIPKELQYSPDPAAGFRHAMYTLVGLVIALLALLLVCVALLKKRAKERTRHMGF